MISILIPTLNEARVIERTLLALAPATRRGDAEVIVADGGSTDGTARIAARYAQVVRCPRGRGRQLNEAARHAAGAVLFFVHADMQVPDGALAAISEQLSRGFDGGGFANEFDTHDRKIKRLGRIMNLRLFANREQSDRGIFYGDNGIFVKADVFAELGGFRDIPIMEDYDFSIRMRRRFKVQQIKRPKLIVSARRHVESGFIKTRMQWIVIRRLYQLGVSPHLLARWYGFK